MRRAVTLILALAALLAFEAQSTAYARTAGASLTDIDAAGSVMPDCADQAQRDQSCCPECERGLLACGSGMACGMPTGLQPHEVSAPGPMSTAESRSQTLAYRLVGRSLKPETHPPSATI